MSAVNNIPYTPESFDREFGFMLKLGIVAKDGYEKIKAFACDKNNKPRSQRDGAVERII